MKAKTTHLPMTKEVTSAFCAKRCLQDKAWARQIRSNPARVLGMDGEKVVTVQNTADTLNICVPDYRAMNDGSLDEISDEQMAGVSGGLFFLFGLLGLIGTAGAVGAAAAVGAGAAAAGGAMIAESQVKPEDAAGG